MRRILASLTAALLLSACTGETDDTSPRASSSPTPTSRPVLQTAKPVVAKPTGPPPTKLVRTDLIVGTGDYALPGKVVSVHYVGVYFKDGKQFDSSWEKGHPLQFQLGTGDVIPGWDEGVVGMRVGGRRRLEIPSELAYGEQGNPPIGPNEPLVFVVDLVGVGGAVARPNETG